MAKLPTRAAGAGAAPAPPRLRNLQACLAILAVIAVGFTMWALRPILTPLVLAVFLLLMIDGMARAMVRRARWLPRRVATPAAVAVIVGVFALAVWLAADNGADFVAHGGDYTVKLDRVLAEVAERMHLAHSPTIASLIAHVSPGEAAARAAEALRHVGESVVFVLIYLGFLLASRRGFAAKAAELFKGEAERREAILLFDRVATGVESYVWVQTVIGVLIAGLSALLMWALGLEHILFWTFIIFLTNYIPAIGAAIGVLFPPLFGLLQYDDLWRPAVMLVGMEAIHFVVSHIVQPRMQGRSLNLDPLVVLFALAFWGTVWGVAGAFLSTPLTVAAMAALAEFPGTRWIAVLLSGDGRPYADLGRVVEDAGPDGGKG